MKRIVVFIVTLLLFASSYAQEFSSFTDEDFKKDENYGWFNYIQVTGYKGQHMTPRGFEDFFQDGFWGTGIRFGTQSTGRKEWQRVHAYPQYGVGVSFLNLGGMEIDSLLGKPMSFYFFYGEPIVRFNRFRLNFDVEIGLSTDFNAYDADENPDQIFIGATTNLHSSFSLQLYSQISQRMDLAFGVSFKHFSNGKMFTPQKGINLIGLNLSTAYHFNPVKNFTKHDDPEYQPEIRPTFIKQKKAAFNSIHELSFMGSIGTVQADPGEWKYEDGSLDTTNATGPRYITNSFTIDYGYQFARRVKLMAGFDMFIDQNAENLYDDILPGDVTFSEKAHYGAHLGFQYLIERVAFVFNYGRYIYKPFDQRGTWFMRAGGRIGITPKFDAQITLKTRNGGRADWIEWGLVYKIKSK